MIAATAPIKCVKCCYLGNTARSGVCGENKCDNLDESRTDFGLLTQHLVDSTARLRYYNKRGFIWVEKLKK